MEELSY